MVHKAGTLFQSRFHLASCQDRITNIESRLENHDAFLVDPAYCSCKHLSLDERSASNQNNLKLGNGLAKASNKENVGSIKVRLLSDNPAEIETQTKLKDESNWADAVIFKRMAWRRMLVSMVAPLNAVANPCPRDHLARGSVRSRPCCAKGTVYRELALCEGQLLRRSMCNQILLHVSAAMYEQLRVHKMLNKAAARQLNCLHEEVRKTKR